MLPMLLGLVAGARVHRGLGKSTHPPAHLKENVAGMGLLGITGEFVAGLSSRA